MIRRLMTPMRSEWNIRKKAAEDLGKIGDERAIEPLIGALTQDRYYDVRVAAASALGNFKNPIITKILGEVLKNENEVSQVRGAAAISLGGTGDPQAAPYLREALTYDYEIAMYAGEALKKLKDVIPLGIEYLREAGPDYPDKSDVIERNARLWGIQAARPLTLPEITHILDKDADISTIQRIRPILISKWDYEGKPQRTVLEKGKIKRDEENRVAVFKMLVKAGSPYRFVSSPLNVMSRRKIHFPEERLSGGHVADPTTHIHMIDGKIDATESGKEFNSLMRCSLGGMAREPDGFLRIDPPVCVYREGFVREALGKKEIAEEDFLRYEQLLAGQIIGTVRFLAQDGGINRGKELTLLGTVKEVLRRQHCELPEEMTIEEFLILVENFEIDNTVTALRPHSLAYHRATLYLNPQYSDGPVEVLDGLESGADDKYRHARALGWSVEKIAEVVKKIDEQRKAQYMDRIPIFFTYDPTDDAFFISGNISNPNLRINLNYLMANPDILIELFPYLNSVAWAIYRESDIGTLSKARLSASSACENRDLIAGCYPEYARQKLEYYRNIGTNPIVRDIVAEKRKFIASVPDDWRVPKRGDSAQMERQKAEELIKRLTAPNAEALLSEAMLCLVYAGMPEMDQAGQTSLKNTAGGFIEIAKQWAPKSNVEEILKNGLAELQSHLSGLDPAEEPPPQSTISGTARTGLGAGIVALLSAQLAAFGLIPAVIPFGIALTSAILFIHAHLARKSLSELTPQQPRAPNIFTDSSEIAHYISLKEWLKDVKDSFHSRQFNKLFTFLTHEPFHAISKSNIFAYTMQAILVTAVSTVVLFYYSEALFAAGIIAGVFGGEDAINSLAETFRNSRTHPPRREAAEILIKSDSPKAVAVFIEVLTDKDENSYIRGVAAGALGKMGKPEAVDPLAAALKDEDARVGEVAARALGEIGDIDITTVEVLRGLLPNEDWRVSRRTTAVAETLGKIGDRQAVPLLLGVAGSERYDGDVRKAAMISLGQIGDPIAVEVLIEILKEEKWTLRNAAKTALGLLGELAVPALVGVLQDKTQEKDAREAAIKVLEGIKSTNAVPPLIEALKDEEHAICSSAARALENIQHPRAQFCSSLYRGAIKAIVEKGSSQVDALIEALDSGHEVVKYAAKALGQIGAPKAAEPLSKLLGSKNYGVSDSVIKAMAAIGEPSIEILAGILKDETEGNKKACRAAAKALGLIDSPKTVPPLIGALKHKDNRLCGIALESLGRVGDSRAIPPLFEAFNKGKGQEIQHEGLWDIGDQPHYAAAVSLGQVFRRTKNPEILSTLREHLHGEDSQLKALSIIALGETGEAQVVEWLTPFFYADGTQPRHACAKALEKLGFSWGSWEFKDIERINRLLIEAVAESEPVNTAVFIIYPPVENRAQFGCGPYSVTTERRVAELIHHDGLGHKIWEHVETNVKTTMIPGAINTEFFNGTLNGVPQDASGYLRLDPPKDKADVNSLSEEDRSELLSVFVRIAAFLARPGGINPDKKFVLIDNVKESFRKLKPDLPDEFTLGEFVNVMKSVKFEPVSVAIEEAKVTDGPAEATQAPTLQDDDPNTTSMELVVTAPRGIHPRSTTEIIQVVSRYPGIDITIAKGRKIAPADSAIKLISLPAGNGDVVKITAKGSLREERGKAIRDLVAIISPEGNPVAEGGPERSQGGPAYSPFRDLRKARQLIKNKREVIISDLFAGRKVVLAFSRNLYGFDEQHLTLIGQLERWKKQMVRLYPRLEGVMDNLIITDFTSRKELLHKLVNEHKLSLRDAENNLIFTFAPEGEQENLKDMGKAVRAVYIKEHQHSEFSLRDYYPLIDIVVISLVKAHMDYTIDEIYAIFKSLGIGREELMEKMNIKEMNDEVPGAFLIFTLIPRAKRYDPQEKFDRHARILRFLHST